MKDPTRPFELPPGRPYVIHGELTFGKHQHYTVAFVRRDDGPWDVAAAVASPKDTFSPRIGHARAIGRLKSERYCMELWPPIAGIHSRQELEKLAHDVAMGFLISREIRNYDAQHEAKA